MKLHGSVRINGKQYREGDEVPWKFVYPFFLLHMLMFGGAGFFMAYGDERPDIGFLYMHGGLAIVVYMVFYLIIFGRDEIKWMLINAGLGVLGIYGEMNWLLSFFGKTMDTYPVQVHVIPFVYYVLYTFLLRQAVLDATGSRSDEARRTIVNRCYVGASLLIYGGIYLLN